jgi:hypothetical protein
LEPQLISGFRPLALFTALREWEGWLPGHGGSPLIRKTPEREHLISFGKTNWLCSAKNGRFDTCHTNTSNITYFIKGYISRCSSDRVIASMMAARGRELARDKAALPHSN